PVICRLSPEDVREDGKPFSKISCNVWWVSVLAFYVALLLMPFMSELIPAIAAPMGEFGDIAEHTMRQKIGFQAVWSALYLLFNSANVVWFRWRITNSKKKMRAFWLYMFLSAVFCMIISVLAILLA
ncbi:MAG: hypothetical protein IJP03_00155, partial [Christensenellaceae bacterium]|nr:hypothetical protein [Christensenellaceae bacterium]